MSVTPPTPTTHHPDLRAALHTALSAQLAIWRALTTLETLLDLPDGVGDTLQDRLEEFALGIESPEALDDAAIDRAIAHLCAAKEAR